MARQNELLVTIGQQQLAAFQIQQQMQALQQLNFSNPALYPGNTFDTVIQNLQLQLFQLQNSPESQQLPIYRQLLAQIMSQNGQVTPSPVSTGSVPSNGGAQPARSTSSPGAARGQLRIDQLFSATNSRTVSTSSKQKHPKQEPKDPADPT